MVHVEGVIRHRIVSGVRFFKKEKWEEFPFSIYLPKGGDKQTVEIMTVERIDRDDRVFVNATVSGIPCYLADMSQNQRGHQVNFNMLSVAGIQVRGTATLTEASTSSQSDAFVA